MGFYQNKSVRVVIGDGDVVMVGKYAKDPTGGMILGFSPCAQADGIRRLNQVPPPDGPPVVEILFKRLDVLEAFVTAMNHNLKVAQCYAAGIEPPPLPESPAEEAK